GNASRRGGGMAPGILESWAAQHRLAADCGRCDHEPGRLKPRVRWTQRAATHGGKTMVRFHLAQVNIGRLRAPLEDPIMDGFRSQLDPINALADRSAGFVWRLQTEDGNATAIRPFADERMAVNMSVCESLDALQQFVYRTAHVGPLRERRDWFEPSEGPILVLWWVAAVDS